MTTNSQQGQIGLAGEYAVLSALILNGFNAARTDGNSKDIDILCTHPDSFSAIKVQVKTQGPQVCYGGKKSSPFYSFWVTEPDRYLNGYRQTILDQGIYFVFYLCPQLETTPKTQPFDANRTAGRFFVASPQEVVWQLDAQLENARPGRLQFRVFEENNRTCEKYHGDLIKDFENQWDKLMAR